MKTRRRQRDTLVSVNILIGEEGDIAAVLLDDFVDKWRQEFARLSVRGVLYFYDKNHPCLAEMKSLGAIKEGEVDAGLFVMRIRIKGAKDPRALVSGLIEGANAIFMAGWYTIRSNVGVSKVRGQLRRYLPNWRRGITRIAPVREAISIVYKGTSP